MRSRRSFLAGITLAVVVAGALGATLLQEEGKIRVLIVTGFDVESHKWRDTSELTRVTLEESDRFEVRVCEDIGIFESSSLGSYDAVILNYGFWTAPDPSEKGKAGLLEFVESGKGLVSLHFACSSFQKWDEYATLLGRVWKQGMGGHGPKGEFTVKIEAKDHPITEGMSNFTIDDELYAKLSGDAEIEVLANAYSDWSERVEPIVFVKKYGEGRVVHNVLGHGLEPRKNEDFKKLLTRGVEWAATGKVAK